MANIQCKMCGGSLDLPEGVSSGVCPYCGTASTFPRLTGELVVNLYNRAEHFRRNCDYDRAAGAYEAVIRELPDDPEAYWGSVIARFGIEYVEDPVSHERIPTCHRVQYDSILADSDYLAALERAGVNERAIYEAEAARIAEIQKNILAISGKEKPFDVFICYKESDDDGKRTRDSVTAQEIYYALQREGLKVFFARITLEKKLGEHYEPYIFAALNSAKVMLVIGSKPEYFNAVWVRNEWSRFLALMKKDRSKMLIPCYKDMDAYDMPDALSLFQSQDMSRIGFMQDIIHGIRKVVPVSRDDDTVMPAEKKEKVLHPLLRRAGLFIKSGDFESAIEYCERVLDQEPENGWAYFYRMMAENKVQQEDMLGSIVLKNYNTLKLAEDFADENLQSILSGIKAKMQKKSREGQLAAVPQKKKMSATVVQAVDPAAIPAGLIVKKGVVVKMENQQCTVCSVPEGVMEIGSGAFANCKNLNQVFLPQSLRKISSSAFRECANLSQIDLPDGLLEIGPGAFFGCRHLIVLNIPAGITVIPELCFNGCENLAQVNFPQGLQQINRYAFAHCEKLSQAVLPHSVRVEKSAFYNSQCEKMVKKYYRIFTHEVSSGEDEEENKFFESIQAFFSIVVGTIVIILVLCSCIYG